MRGAHVIIASRNPKAANDSKEMILQMYPNARIDCLQLDLSSIKSVRSFIHQFLALNVPLNILINNAGVMFCPFQLSEDEIESQFATNHIGFRENDLANKSPIRSLILSYACHVKSTKTAPVMVLGGVDACRWRQDATAPARTSLLHGDNGSLVIRATPSVKALAPVAWLTVNWTAR
ncbi:hypothetical protein F2Q70_00024918 [Brassica cretica]|uniref:Uncharacterized protein n=1 Tax=Brassica cretica TaxID=69181 RepID=A0A8S9LIP2_BRACR|nr:hypothetical protein F2Q70_00024918 [Brassica cretica]